MTFILNVASHHFAKSATHSFSMQQRVTLHANNITNWHVFSLNFSFRKELWHGKPYELFLCVISWSTWVALLGTAWCGYEGSWWGKVKKLLTRKAGLLDKMVVYVSRRVYPWCRSRSAGAGVKVMLGPGPQRLRWNESTWELRWLPAP